MLKNDTLKNGTSCIGLYRSAPWGRGGGGVTTQVRIEQKTLSGVVVIIMETSIYFSYKT